jgi:hypothetical protein
MVIWITHANYWGRLDVRRCHLRITVAQANGGTSLTPPVVAPIRVNDRIVEYCDDLTSDEDRRGAWVSRRSAQEYAGLQVV